MSKQTSSQPQHNDIPNPFATFAQGPWIHMAKAGLEQTQSMFEQFGKLEQASQERVKAAWNDMHRLVVDSIEYTTKLHNEWRNLALEGMRNLVANSKDAA